MACIHRARPAQGPDPQCPAGHQFELDPAPAPGSGRGGTFKQIDLEAGAYAEKNAAVRRLRMTAFVCPTQRAALPTDSPPSSYAGCHHKVEAPIAEDNHGVLFLNSRISERDVTDGVQHTIYVGEKRNDAGDLGWMSGTRATLRNTARPSARRARSGQPTISSWRFRRLSSGRRNFLFWGRQRAVPRHGDRPGGLPAIGPSCRRQAREERADAGVSDCLESFGRDRH